MNPTPVDPTTTLSPKVLLGAVVAAVAPAVAALILEHTGLTIDVSVVQAVIFSAVSALSVLVAGWLKNDPLRRTPLPETVITSTTRTVGELPGPAQISNHLAEHQTHALPPLKGDTV